MSTLAIESLISKRDALLSEKAAMEAKFNLEISELDAAIDLLKGKEVWQIGEGTFYNDEHPDYIKSSQEEI